MLATRAANSITSLEEMTTFSATESSVARAHAAEIRLKQELPPQIPNGRYGPNAQETHFVFNDSGMQGVSSLSQGIHMHVHKNDVIFEIVCALKTPQNASTLHLRRAGQELLSGTKNKQHGGNPDRQLGNDAQNTETRRKRRTRLGHRTKLAESQEAEGRHHGIRGWDREPGKPR